MRGRKVVLKFVDARPRGGIGRGRGVSFEEARTVLEDDEPLFLDNSTVACFKALAVASRH